MVEEKVSTSMFPSHDPLKIFETEVWPSLCDCDPLIFWALNANFSNTVKGIDFKFHKHVPRDSPDLTFTKFLTRGHDQSHVTV